MRRTLITLFCVISLNIQAQEFITVNTDVNLSGDAIAFCESPKFDCKNPYLQSGYKWNLTNKVLLGQNFITFCIKDEQGNEYNNAFWPEGCEIKMMVDNGLHCYAVQDKTFRHLMIFERDDHSGYIVLLGSTPIQ